MIHFHDGRDALGCTDPQHRNLYWIRHRVAIERYNLKRVTWQGCEFPWRCRSRHGTGLARLFDANRLAVAEHPSVDGEEPIAYFVSMWHAFSERGLHGRLSYIFELLVARSRGQEILRHVSAAAEAGLELLQDQKHLAVIPAWLVFRIDIHLSHFPTVLPRVQVRACAIVRVIKTEARRTGYECNPPLTVGGNIGRALLGSSVHIGWHFLTVPVQLLRRIRVVKDVDSYLAPLFEAKQRSRKLPVGGNQRNDSLCGNPDRRRLDVQRVVCRNRFASVSVGLTAFYRCARSGQSSHG